MFLRFGDVLRRRNVQFGLIRTAASGDESFVAVGCGGFEFRRRSSKNCHGLSRTVFGGFRIIAIASSIL